MEKINWDNDITISYEDFINLNYIIEANFIIIEKIKKHMILEKNIEQIKVLNEVCTTHKNILNNIINILERGKVKVYE